MSKEEQLHITRRTAEERFAATISLRELVNLLLTLLGDAVDKLPPDQLAKVQELKSIVADEQAAKAAVLSPLKDESSPMSE